MMDDRLEGSIQIEKLYERSCCDGLRKAERSFYYIAIRCSMVLTDRRITSLGFCLQDWGVDAGFLEEYLEKLPQGIL